VAAPVGDTVTPVVDQVAVATPPVADTVTPVTDALTAVAARVGDTVAPVADQVAGASQIVSQTASPSGGTALDLTILAQPVVPPSLETDLVMPAAEPLATVPSTSSQGGSMLEIPDDLGPSLVTALGSVDGRLIVSGTAVLLLSARAASSSWGFAEMANACAMNVRMSFEAVRVLPCRSAMAVRSVATQLVQQTVVGTAVARTEGPPARLAPRERPWSLPAVRVPSTRIAPVWELPLRDTFAIRMIAAAAAAVSGMVALVAGVRDELEERRRRPYRGRLQA